MNVLKGMVAGALVGAGAAILFAPASGGETRQLLRNRVSDGKRRLNDTATSIRGTVEEAVNETKNRFQTEKERLAAAVEAGKEAYLAEKHA